MINSILTLLTIYCSQILSYEHLIATWQCCSWQERGLMLLLLAFWVKTSFSLILKSSCQHIWNYRLLQIWNTDEHEAMQALAITAPHHSKCMQFLFSIPLVLKVTNEYDVLLFLFCFSCSNSRWQASTKSYQVKPFAFSVASSTPFNFYDSL